MTQKLGIVNLVSFFDDYPSTKLNFEYFRQALKLGSCTPVRLVAIYMLLVDHNENAAAAAATTASSAYKDAWKNVIDFACYTMGKILRLRTRLVSGT